MAWRDLIGAAWVSGPSATADIEMTPHSKGVQGPRFPHVILVQDEALRRLSRENELRRSLQLAFYAVGTPAQSPEVAFVDRDWLWGTRVLSPGPASSANRREGAIRSTLVCP